MRIVIITQDDPFYLPVLMPQFLKKLGQEVEIAGTVLLSASPFGKKESFFKKVVKTFNIFGFKFFVFYSFIYLYNKYLMRRSVKRSLNDSGIDILELDRSINHQASLKKIIALKPDLLISILGNEIFKSDLLKIAPCLNLHSAPLPKYRGLLPSFWVLKNHEKTSAVSVFFVDEGIDTGAIILQRWFEVTMKTHKEFVLFTKKLGLDLIIAAVKKFKSGDYSLQENDNNLATYYKFPTRNDVNEFKKNGGRLL